MKGPVGLAYSLRFRGTADLLISVTFQQGALHDTVTFSYEEDDEKKKAVLIHYNWNKLLSDFIDAKSYSKEDARKLWDRLVKEGFELYGN